MRRKIAKDAAGAGAAKPIYRLSDIAVEEVSLVDRPANQRKFLVVKSAGAGAEVVPDGKGGAKLAKDDTTEAGALDTTPGSTPKTPPPAADPEKLRVSPDVKKAVLARLAFGVAKANELIAALNAAEEAAGAELPQLVADRVGEILSALATGEGVDVAKAAWDAAYINDLPDSAFLYVEPGGTKDAGGKTTPRSLRHFPVRDSSGSPDLPHIRNALARIPQSGVPQAAKDKAVAEAQRMLAAAKKSEGLGAIEAAAATIVEKGRKQISMEREAKLRAAHSALGEILAALPAIEKGEDSPTPPAVPAPTPTPPAATPPAPAASAAPDLLKELETHIGPMIAKAVAPVTQAVAKQAERIDAIDRGREVSGAAPEPVEKTAGESEAREESGGGWSVDMSDPDRFRPSKTPAEARIR